MASTDSRTPIYGRGAARVCWLLLVLAASGLLSAVAVAGAPRVAERSSSAASSCSNLLINGGFEAGAATIAPWLSDGFTVLSDHPVHSGSFAIWMGGYKNADDTVFQSVIIPRPTSHATLRYSWRMDTLEDESVAHDLLTISLRAPNGDLRETVAVVDNTSSQGVWNEATHELAEYGGEHLLVHFHCSGNAEAPTSFFLDDVELQVCGRFETPTPTAEPQPTATATREVVERHYLPLIWAGEPD